MKKIKISTMLAPVVFAGAAVFFSCGKSEPSDPAYAVTVSNDGHGTAASAVGGASANKAAAGQTVTITATPSGDYIFKQWVVVSGGVTLSPDAATNPATFTMPAKAVEIRAEFELRIEAQPEANCYMVAPNSEAIYIPVSQANRVLTADGLGAAMTGLGGVTADNYTVELVWGDAPVGASGVIKKLEAYAQDGKGYVRVEPGVAGNAVVCIKDKTSGAVKWSWHIWVTEAVTSKKDTETGLTWMDRNLGAAGTTYNASGKNGLFYQWGRKDAFPASDGTDNIQAYYTQTGGSTSTNANPTGDYTELPQLVQNPLGFAINYDTYRGSVNADNNNDSWGGVSGKKTLYDPCPAGWKVPPVSVNSVDSWGNYIEVDNSEWTFNNYVVTNEGAVFNGVGGTSALAHFYPASGYRSNANGGFNNVGSNGYAWSGSVAGASGYNLSFASTYVSPANGNARAGGFPVRCLQE